MFDTYEKELVGEQTEDGEFMDRRSRCQLAKRVAVFDFRKTHCAKCLYRAMQVLSDPKYELYYFMK
jgi:hypothetical protein